MIWKRMETASSTNPYGVTFLSPQLCPLLAKIDSYLYYIIPIIWLLFRNYTPNVYFTRRHRNLGRLVAQCNQVTRVAIDSFDFYLYLDLVLHILIFRLWSQHFVIRLRYYLGIRLRYYLLRIYLRFGINLGYFVLIYLRYFVLIIDLRYSVLIIDLRYYDLRINLTYYLRSDLRYPHVRINLTYYLLIDPRYYRLSIDLRNSLFFLSPHLRPSVLVAIR